LRLSKAETSIMMDKEKPVPEWLVERLVAGDLPPLKAKRVQSRLERSGELDRLEALRVANQATLTRYHAPTVAAEVQRRLASQADSPVRAEGLRSRGDALRSGLATVWKSHAELRSRLFRVSLAFVGGVLITWAFRVEVLPWLMEPFITMWQAGHSPASLQLHYSTPVPLFPTYVRVALLGGFVFALPVMLHHFWAFMASRAGLRGTGLGLPFVATSCSVLYLGAWFAWRVWLPLAVDQWTSFGGPAGVVVHWAPSILLSDYVELATAFLLALGFAAEIPIALLFLRLARLVTYDQLVGFFRYFVVLALVIAALLTPPDLLSQLLLAGVFCASYACSLGVAFLVGRYWVKN
jgi:sec-independent protein translocase protein TatC